MQTLAEIEPEYICSICTHTDGARDCIKSLARLGEAANVGLQKLQSAVHLEDILLSNTEHGNLTKSSEILLGSKRTDLVEEKLHEKMSRAEDRKPVSVSADGNGLFSALSVSIVSDESLSPELRVRTKIELVNFQAYHEEELKGNICLVAPDYEEACLASATLGSYSSAWIIQAVASVIKWSIVSTYSSVNFVLDRCFGILNTTFRPQLENCLQPVNIM